MYVYYMSILFNILIPPTYKKQRKERGKIVEYDRKSAKKSAC